MIVNSRFRVSFENLTPGELGLLLIALGLGEPRWYPKLGGGKPACLGTIEVVEPKVEITEPMQQCYNDFDMPAPQARDIPALLQAARHEHLVLEEQVRRFGGHPALAPRRPPVSRSELLEQFLLTCHAFDALAEPVAANACRVSNNAWEWALCEIPE